MQFIWSNFDENSEFAKLARETKQNNDASFWPNMRKVIGHDCDSLPLSRFRLWASIALVPIVNRTKHWNFIGAAFNGALKSDVVKKALEENWVGVPMTQEDVNNFLVADDFSTSMTRVIDVGHIMMCNFDPTEIQNYKSIVEVGAGYGNMCSVIHSLGFKGKYTIFDFEEMHKLQRFYLERNGIYGVNYVTEVDQLESADLVIGTWSISEIPLELREQILNKLWGTPNWLIAYQDHTFSGAWSNSEYLHNKFKDFSYEESHIRHSEYDGVNNHFYVNNFSRNKA